MRPTPSLLLLGLGCGLPCWAQAGLSGITSPIDDPACAYACTRSLANFGLECSVEDHSGHGGHGHGPPIHTSPECRAHDDAYLTSLAWCLNTKCAEYDVPTSRLQSIWEHEATGDPSVPAKWSYSEALLNVGDPPTRQLVMGDTLNTTSLAPESWATVFNTAVVMAYETTMESIYGFVCPHLSRSRVMATVLTKETDSSSCSPASQCPSYSTCSGTSRG